MKRIPGKNIQEGGLKKVFYEYHRPLCFFAEKIVKDKADAEDIVEDVFIKLWQKEPDFSRYKNIKAALYIAVKHACFNHIRQQQRQQARLDEFTHDAMQADEHFALLEIVRAEVLREVYDALQLLPEQCRTVMYLAYLKGWENKKIAHHLNIHTSTVKTQKARGILALRKKIIVPFLLFFLQNILA